MQQLGEDGSETKRLAGITELCVDAKLSWMLEYVPNVRELVVWSWPSDVDREGGLNEEETTDGWRTFLARLNAQAPNVEEVEVGGLSVYDANELFPLTNLFQKSLSNYTPFSTLTTLRILHRKEEHGALPLPHPAIPSALDESITSIWDDTDQEQNVSGQAGAVKRIVYFDLQDECASCYVPSVDEYEDEEQEEEEGGEENRDEENDEGGEGGGGWWDDDAPAVVLSCVKARWGSS
ncbi:hypothetical protein FRC07_008450 [Ceratobasidium sp. 392]|nr:hypothetical protein FRC07_008450 [Ceratobasidium sp. 392]